jgi:hypothetical protein
MYTGDTVTISTLRATFKGKRKVPRERIKTCISVYPIGPIRLDSVFNQCALCVVFVVKKHDHVWSLGRNWQWYELCDLACVLLSNCSRMQFKAENQTSKWRSKNLKRSTRCKTKPYADATRKNKQYLYIKKHSPKLPLPSSSTFSRHTPSLP